MISHKSKGFVYPDYISPLPADEFIKGALLKQKMYDEGIDKVQQQLDSYGEIRKTLLKEEDKAYFDQEATKLVSALNKNAGLDFANKNNLRAALSLGKNLVNDPIITAAAESASTYKKMMEEYNKLDPKNKSAANDYFFMKDINNWLNDGKYGSKLKYNPYTVYTDEHVKLWKELSTSLKPEEQEFPVFDGASGEWIVQKKFSGVTAERFRDAYINGLSAQAKNQLELEARYSLEVGDKNNITNFYNQDLQTKLTAVDLQLNSLSDQRQKVASKYGDQSPEVMRLNQEITKLNATKTFYSNKQAAQVSDTDLVNFLKEDKILDAAGAFAYRNESSKLEANPYVVDIRKMQNNLAEYQAKAQIDIAKEEELVRRGLKDGATNPMIGPGAYIPDADFTAKPVIQDMKSFYGQATSTQEGKMWQLGIARFGEGKTVGETLERASVENTWDPTDRRTINESFLPSGFKQLPVEQQKKNIDRAQRITEDLLWKFKGIYNTLNGGTISNNKDETISVTPGSTVSILETTGGVRDMSVDAFLKQPGEYLAIVKEIRVKDPNKAN